MADDSSGRVRDTGDSDELKGSLQPTVVRHHGPGPSLRAAVMTDEEVDSLLEASVLAGMSFCGVCPLVMRWK